MHLSARLMYVQNAAPVVGGRAGFMFVHRAFVLFMFVTGISPQPPFDGPVSHAAIAILLGTGKPRCYPTAFSNYKFSLKNGLLSKFTFTLISLK